MLSADAAHTLLRRFLDTYEGHDLDTLWSFYADDCRFPVLERFGIEATWPEYRAFMARFLSAFPDLHHVIEKLVTDGRDVWVLYTITGTQQGPLRGMAPTGRSVRYSLVAMYRIEDERIVEADFVSDDLTMMRQLGTVSDRA